ncbi:COG1470 family protein [Pyrococcus yayanosii]|uniref:CARDB domain-containing protein n=1 Tax=Pyrococcus yayanosii (strain CH1 / JCM 16557) TaxID=529709 RepID=F8AF83_PYRYC|nr:hypothetical protein [Pyrococcus yayanosii]AEH24911.1 hypothetical protein PYCH_12330 [Pyrococcus yayanosii CH1]
MKRMFLVLFLLLTTPGVLASGLAVWVTVPIDMILGEYSVSFLDVSLDGSVLVKITYGDRVVYKSIMPGKRELFGLCPNADCEYIPFGNLSIDIERILLAGKNYILANVTFPPILVGQSVSVGPVSFMLTSVGPTGFSITASDGETTKTFSTKSFTFAGYRVTVDPYPLVFSGNVRVGDEITYYSMVLKVVSVNTTGLNGELVNSVIMEFNGSTYEIPEGSSGDVGPFRVDVKRIVCEYTDNICNPIIFLEVHLRGAIIRVERNPDYDFWLYVGQDYRIGPYLIRAEGSEGGLAYISIRNLCGDILVAKYLPIESRVIKGLGYGGLDLGIVGTETDAKGVRLHIIAFYDPALKPKLEHFAWLNISLEGPKNVTQYEKFPLTIRVKNVGEDRLFNVKLYFMPGNGIEVLDECVGCLFLESLKPGEEKTLIVHVRALKSGVLEVGNVRALVPIPYPLVCGGCDQLEFYSNSPIITVTPAHVTYTVELTLPEVVRAGEPFVASLKVKNAGNVAIPANLTLNLPPGFGLVNGSSLLEKWVVIPLSLSPGEEWLGNVTLVAVSPGIYNVTAIVDTLGGPAGTGRAELEVKADERVVQAPATTVTETVGKYLTTTVTNTTTLTITQTVKRTATATTTTTVTVPYAPLGTKLLFLGLGAAAGAGAVILYAWWRARKS